MKPYASLPLLLLVLSGCSLADGSDEVFSTAKTSTTTLVVDLQDGERIALPPFDASLRLVEASDHRCAIDVVCASAGWATLVLALEPSGQTPVSFTLEWPWAEGQGLDEEGFLYRDVEPFRFTLLDLRPYPDTRIPDPGPSIATLRIERLPSLFPSL
jgi:hypothetical protein